MYGIITKTKDFDTRETKLKEIQKQNRDCTDLKERFEQINTSFDALRKELANLVQTVDAFRKDIYGEQTEEDDTENSGFVHNFKLRLDEQREEYFSLVEKYMNELDRKRLEDFEARIHKLETDKPKINIVSSSKVPSIDIEKKFERSQTESRFKK